MDSQGGAPRHMLSVKRPVGDRLAFGHAIRLIHLSPPERPNDGARPLWTDFGEMPSFGSSSAGAPFVARSASADDPRLVRKVESHRRVLVRPQRPASAARDHPFTDRADRQHHAWSESRMMVPMKV